MISEDGARLMLAGPLTLATVAGLAEQGRSFVVAADRVVDLSAVTRVDSSALALLLSWTRAARAAGRQFSVTGAPSALVSLASLYDVDTILSFGH